MKQSHIALMLSPVLLAACMESSGPSVEGPALAIAIAPLTLSEVVDACYGVTVYNEPRASIGPAAVVWTEPSVCASRFGDGEGAITYIGTCDASPDGRINTVSLVLNGLCKTAGCDVSNAADPRTLPAASYQNPCPATRPCLLERSCSENADTLVEFNLTILRAANQGFFDIAVNFEDVFCSAKLDCVSELLHRPPGTSGTPRDLTAVLGFACTSGASNTCLYATRVELDCGGANVWTLDPSAGPGNIPESSPLLFGAATYAGDEAFTAFDKSYWNIALGLDETLFATYPNCTLRWTTTASEDPLIDQTTPLGTTYPVIRWERQVITNGALTCGSHPLNQVLANETVASVATHYTEVDAPEVFPFTNCAPGQASCSCPQGFAPNVAGTVCQRVIPVVTAPTQTLDVCNGYDQPGLGYSAYGANFTASWDPATFEVNESNVNACTSQAPSGCRNVTQGWTNYLLGVGIWACGDRGPSGFEMTPYDAWLGFSRCVTLSTAGDYLVGLAGDNRVRLVIDGAQVYESVSSLSFGSWNVGRVSLTAGTHVIELYGLNVDAIASFGAEIYGPFTPGSVTTPTQMIAALGTPPINNNLIVFSTRDLRPVNGQPIASFQAVTGADNPYGYSCPAGFAVNVCGATPTCSTALPLEAACNPR